PDLLAREDLGGVTELLLLGAVRNDGRPGHPHAEDIEDGWSLRERHLLVEDHLLEERETPPTVFLWPRQPDEPGVVELALPGPHGGVRLGPRYVGAAHRARFPVARDVGREPRPDLFAKCLLLGSQREVHFPLLGGARRPPLGPFLEGVTLPIRGVVYRKAA